MWPNCWFFILENNLLYRFYLHWALEQDYLNLIFYIWIFRVSCLEFFPTLDLIYIYIYIYNIYTPTMKFWHDGRKAVWSIPYVSVAFFPSLKQNFIAYHSSKVSEFIFEIHQLCQSGFSRVYSNCCCSCSFKLEIIKIGQSSHKMYSNNILNFQESTTILNVHTKKVWKIIVCTLYVYVWLKEDSGFFLKIYKLFMHFILLTFIFK